MISPQYCGVGKRVAQPRARRRRILEFLESRCLLASLTGEVFLDTDDDGVRGPSESGVADVRVYLDTNNNSNLDAGEQTTTTNALGFYQFDNLLPGAYSVRVETVGTVQTSPQAFVGTGNLASAGGSTQLFESTSNGNVFPIGSANSVPITGLVRTNDGTLIGVSDLTNGVYRLDSATGQEILLSQPAERLAAGLAYDPGTDTIYTVVDDGGTFELRAVDKVTGQLGPSISSAAGEVRAINFGSTFYDFDLSAETAVELPRQTLSPFASTLDSRSDGAIFGLQGDALNQYSFPAEGSTATQLSTLSASIEAISFDANDQLFGVSTLPSAFHQIDPLTGTVSAGVPITFEGNPISGVTGFDIAPDGTHYLVDSTHLYAFDPATGVATQAPNRALPPFSPIFTSLSAGPDGSLFATLFNTTTPIAQVNPATGLATRLGDQPEGSPYASLVTRSSFSGLPGLTGISDLTFDPVGQRIVGFDDDNDRFFQFTTDGLGSLLATADRLLDASSLAYDGTSFVMFDADDPSGQTAISVDPDTGAIGAGLIASQGVFAQSLFHGSTGDVAHRVSLGVNDATGLDFGISTNLPPGIAIENPGFLINELMIDPLSGDANTDQYVELRGPAGAQLPDGTYLVVVEEDDFGRGSIHGIFDLSNQQLGDNGFLVLLQQGNSYNVNPQSAVLESTAAGFGGLPGDLYSDSFPLADRIDFVLGANGFFLIQ
ncbi:MAG: hypothetical protein MI861_20995, partial [Pirellulales bacterium]|nr:hypothetical protein [Pirellulales bacterium]